MITDGEIWHYTAVTRLSGLLRGVTGNKNGDSYCLNCLHAYRTENKPEKHKKICEIMIIAMQKRLMKTIK